jgi:hypothetical protein
VGCGSVNWNILTQACQKSDKYKYSYTEKPFMVVAYLHIIVENILLLHSSNWDLFLAKSSCYSSNKFDHNHKFDLCIYFIALYLNFRFVSQNNL